MTQAKAAIKVFTDPTCPFAYSTEPARWRLRWLFGDQIQWEHVMIVLSSKPEDHIQKSFTPEKQAKVLKRLKEQHGMPIDDSARPRVAVSLQACRAYIATLLNGPEKADAILRQLRIASMAGKLVDEPDAIHAAADEAGVETGALDQWLRQDQVEQKLKKAMDEARRPTEAALAMKHKLSALAEGGYRYSAPSYQLYKDGILKFEIPGFWGQPFYDIGLSNIAPDLERRENPQNVREVLEWAGEPLATVEVAAVLDNGDTEAVRNALQKIAVLSPVGQDGFWSLHS